MPATPHILIVGGGVIGLSTAYYALRRGLRVTVLERGPVDRDCCSLGNAGMIVPSHFIPLAAPGAVSQALRWMWNPASPLYIQPRLDWDLLTWGLRFLRAANHRHVARSAPLLRDLSLASRALFEEFSRLPDTDIGLVSRGLFMLCKTAHGLDEEVVTARRARDLGIPAEVLDSRQLAEREPDIAMDVAGAVLFPKDCHLTPEPFMRALLRHITAMQGTLHWETSVQGWHTDRGAVTRVRTNRGEFTADEFVLCGGSWTPETARGLGLRLPLQAGKGYSLTLPQPRRLPRTCAILTEARVAVTPMGSTLRFGGTMEIAGLNTAINPRRVQGIIDAVPRYYPEFQPADFSGIQPWCGLRPVSPDGLPYLGRSRRYRNLILASGHAMMGLSLGPITGQLVAEVLAGDTPSFDLALFEPERFG